MMLHSINGIHASLELMNKAAYEISKGVEDGDIVGAQIDIIKAQRSLEANLAVLKTASQMQHSIIDILA
jgi:flagellar basal body rod protein FlgC